MERKYYGSIDGLRTYACIGIVMMHMLSRDNNQYNISGFVFETIIPSFTNFVFLFMVISAFGMCCGYYERMLKGKVNLTAFYGKRFQRILPFFAVLVLLDLAMNPSMGTLYEAFADLTLMFGLGTAEISVIGVGWFLGTIFVFYLIFPFFCVLMENKRRAWFVLMVSAIWNFASVNYFELNRMNILHSGCFFVAGGLIYLYRNEIEKIKRWVGAGIITISVFLYYSIGNNSMMCLLVSAAFLVYAVLLGGAHDKLLENRFTRFVSGISMEIYLSHMAFFRIFEKVGLNTRFGGGIGQYLLTVVLVLGGSIVFSVLMKKLIYIAGTYAGKHN